MTFTFRDNRLLSPSDASSGVIKVQAPISITDALRAAEHAGFSLSCPDCGSPFDIQYDIDKIVAGEFQVAPRVAFCSGCERIEEF